MEKQKGKEGWGDRVEDVKQWEGGLGRVHHPICDGPDAVPSSEVFYPKRYL